MSVKLTGSKNRPPPLVRSADCCAKFHKEKIKKTMGLDPLKITSIFFVDIR